MRKILLLSCCTILGLSSYAQLANHVVISEIYGGGGNTGATYTNDFIELYNPTSTAISLAGWSVQYAASAGTSWQVTTLSGSIPAKGFYLIQEAAGTGGTTALPTPDKTGTISMSGTGAKIALVNSTTALTTACPTGTTIVDFVGFGTAANCNEGGTNAPATTNTTSIERKASDTSTVTSLSTGGSEVLAGNGYDSDNNSTDFVIKPLNEINPQNSSITEGATSNTLSVAIDIQPQEPATNGTFIFTLNTAAPTGGLIITYTLAGTASAGTDYTDANAGSITIPAGSTTTTLTLNIIDDTIAEGNETIALTVTSATGGYSFAPSAITTSIIDDDFATTKINVIQGSGLSATTGTFKAEAIVTGVYPTLSPAGFYMQEEDSDADTDNNTSEGIFVVSNTAVAVGDKVSVTGTTQENTAAPSYSQAVFTNSSVVIVSNNNPMPSTTDITLPVNDITDFEKYEGMLIRFPATLTVTNNYTLGSYGEIGLSAGGSVYQPTQVLDVNDSDPNGTSSTGSSNATAINTLISNNQLRTILLDDGTATTVTLPFADPVDHTLRIGSTITNLTGILGYAYSTYRVQPIVSTPPVFAYAPRPALPSVGSGSVKIASFNVLNYFNGDGLGGGYPTARGAQSAAEFTRQRDKIISAIAQINADAVGLLEIENDGTDANSAIQDLVNGLNNIMGANTYTFINDGATIQTYGTDAIRCGIIYKPATLLPVGAAILSPNTTFNRPPLAQKFQQISTGEVFDFVVNHFKSKGCTSATGLDTDQGDGQSCYNDHRKAQSTELLNFFANTLIPATGTENIISVGDYNSYFEEDPLDILRAGSYHVLSSSSGYSYQFSGQIGSLDHAVVSNAMSSAVTGIAKWNINAAEPVYLDYNDLINDGGGDYVNPYAAYYQANAFRSSDHDPVIVGLDLLSITPIGLPVGLLNFYASANKQAVQLRWEATNKVSNFSLERSAEDGKWQTIAAIAASQTDQNQYSYDDQSPLSGMNFYRLKYSDETGNIFYSPVRKVLWNKDASINIYPNPATDYLFLDINPAQSTKAEVIISNILNQAVLQEAQTWSSHNLINISALRPGTYFLKVVADGSTTTTKRFIKR